MDDYYKSIGFMCGLEVHQRLATKEKLFCACPALVKEDHKPVASVVRYQRAVAGELGAIDATAQFEELRSRSFKYNVFNDDTCLVELDEEPPHTINMEALDIALSVATALKMRIVDEIQPMRKNVIDGSDPSAFQRTAMVALNGSIELNGIKVNLPSMFLEEESCGIVKSDEESVIYSIDRLGIPLIEVDTDPYIPNPTVARDLALHIGTLLRLTGKMQRGIGSIRQDVNMSIKGGARVEIKGAQEVNLIDKFLEVEIKRQQKLLEIMEKLLKAGAKVEAAKDVTKIFAKTKVGIIKKQKDLRVMACALRGFKGMIGTEIAPSRRLGTEMSDYAKKAGVNGIIHSDEKLEGYGFESEELEALSKELKLGAEDAFVLVAASSKNAAEAIELARLRASYALKGVPKETRVVNDSVLCTTAFLRPLPSGSRMYPETDARPIRVDKRMMSEALRNAPDIGKERKYIESMIKNKAIAEQLIRSPRLQTFKLIVEVTKADPEFVANTMLQKFTELRREGFEVDDISEKGLFELFGAYKMEKITKQAVEEVIKALAKGSRPVDEIISELSLARITGKALKSLIEKERASGKAKNSGELRSSVMSKYRLNVDGSELNGLLTSP
jgi:glutamyl-tRNA(Gln) amidotransferase subunit E